MPSPAAPTPPAEAQALRRPRHWLFVALAVVLAVWASGWQGIFQFDDYNVIVHYPPVHSWSAFWADLPHGLRPLLKASYTLNWTTGGVLGFHIFNTAVHLLCTLLVYALAQRMLAWPTVGAASSPHGAALLVALLFALHPVQTEAITYVSGRSASLMALFYLGALLAHDQAQRGALRAGHWKGLALLSLVAATSTKETALTWPVAALLWDAAAGRSMHWRAMLRRYLWYGLALSAIALALVGHARYQRLLEHSAQLHTPLENLFTQSYAMLYLLAQWCLPWRSNIDPDLPLLAGGALAWGSLALWCGLTALALKAWRRQRLWGFALLWWLLQLLPIYVLLARVDVVNDRQLYLAAWPTLVPTVLLGQRLIGHPRLRAGALALLLAVLAGLTVQRNQDYRSEVALWQATVQLSPTKARPHNNLGYAWFEAGDFARAETEYRRALELDPDYWLAQRNLDVLEECSQPAVPCANRRPD